MTLTLRVGVRFFAICLRHVLLRRSLLPMTKIWTPSRLRKEVSHSKLATERSVTQQVGYGKKCHTASLVRKEVSHNKLATKEVSHSKLATKRSVTQQVSNTTEQCVVHVHVWLWLDTEKRKQPEINEILKQLYITCFNVTLFSVCTFYLASFLFVYLECVHNSGFV